MQCVEAVIFDWGGVLIDDRQDFVDGAIAAGMAAIRYERLEQIERELERLSAPLCEGRPT